MDGVRGTVEGRKEGRSSENESLSFLHSIQLQVSGKMIKPRHKLAIFKK